MKETATENEVATTASAAKPECELTKDAIQRFIYLDGQCAQSSHYDAFIDNLDCDSKIKRILRECLTKTAMIGRKVVRIGKIVFDFIIKHLGEIKRRFPNTVNAIIIAAILHVIISSIPFIGLILSVLVEPLFDLGVLGLGILKDLKETLGPIVCRYFGMAPAAAN